ncbi:MAG: PilZ domain-containing protein [Thermodesulfobacteria bacterium]|nr:PilZ domain-containing protein [Thermodesulfobacteriota bacterium]
MQAMSPEIDRRKYPRYCCRLPAFLNERKMQVSLCDLSLGGCFIEAPKEKLLPRGTKVNLVLSLPCVGPLSVTGIVLHHGTPARLGMGVEFIYFPRRLHLVYAKFVKIFPILEEARKLYQRLGSTARR